MLPRSKFYKTQLAWQGVKFEIIPIDLNFHLQKSLEIFDKNSADKIQFKNYKDLNPPCLMLISLDQDLLD